MPPEMIIFAFMNKVRRHFAKPKPLCAISIVSNNKLKSMNAITIYMTGLAMTALISFLIVIYFKPHLKKILLELNGEKERPANFWVAYTIIILMLVPLIFATWIVPDGSNGGINVFFQISRQLKWALTGLVSSLIIIGIIIIRFVPRDNEVKNKNGT